MTTGTPPPVLGFAAFSGTGKTTLLRQIIPLLHQSGLRVGLLKHSHHPVDIDRPGKDSQVLRQAGAQQVLIASKHRTVVIADARAEPQQALSMLSDHLDLILVEGYKHHAWPKIELHRPSRGHPLLCLTDDSVIAVASDAPLPRTIRRPLLDLNDARAITAYITDVFLAQVDQSSSNVSMSGRKRS